MTSVKTPSLEEKVQMYENLLHKIQLCAAVTMSEECMRRLIGNICSWSYAHRQGNGELSQEEQQRLVDSAFWNLTNIDC